MQKTVFLGLSGCSLLLSSLVGIESTSAQVEVNRSHNYPPEIVQQLVQSCVEQKTSVHEVFRRNRVPLTVVQMACQCIVQELQKAYTLEQFSALSESLQQGQQPPAQLRLIEQQCKIENSR